MKRLLASILCLVMLMGTLCVPASAAYELKSFSDVPSSHWAHDAIMKMVAQGLFAGTTTPDANGVGTFAPDATMTRAQFVTVVTRYLYNDELAELNAEDDEPEYWYSHNYEVAVNNGLITEAEFTEADMNKAMTRQEMAMVLVRAAEELGQYPNQLISPLRIADYDTVGSYYQEYVRECYSMGMICGVDSKGTFLPGGTLTRAQAATVLYRLVAPETRQSVDFSVPNTVQNASTMTIYEGQSTSRPAKAGDIFVKADGTKVTLKIGPNGILGEGQGVAPDANLKGQSGHWSGTRFNFITSIDGDWKDSTGRTLQNNDYEINPTTGEGHWEQEWRVIYKANPRPETEGTTPGEVSENGLYYWDPILQMWGNNVSRSR